MSKETASELVAIEKREERLALRELKFGSEGVELTTFDEVWRFAQWAAKSKLIPQGMSGEQVVIAVQKGKELGFSPMQALYSIPVVNGRPTLEGKAMIALVNMHDATTPEGQLDAGCEGQGQDRVGWCESRKKGWSTRRRTEFSWTQAKDAGLTGKGVWKSYGEDMLKWKAVNRHCDTYYPEITHGLMTTSMAMSVYENERDITPEAIAALPLEASVPDPLLASLRDPEPVDAEIIEVVTAHPAAPVVDVEPEPSEVCGKGPSGSECMQPPKHKGKCDWKLTTVDEIESELLV